MEIDASSPTPTSQNTLFTHLKSIVFPSCIKSAIVEIAKKIKKTGQEDPRRIVHAFKMAFAITLVSLVYYLVAFDYGVGATLCKSMNRGFATFLAGALGVGAEGFSDLFGPRVKPIVICSLVFLAVAVASFSRFIPGIKRRYDYGCLIFILTFSLVAVSGYRVEKLIELAHHRFSTIIFGGATGILVSMCVCPANFAWWEIGHGKFLFRHPWKQYLKIGVYTRQCAYHIEALHGYLDTRLEVPSEFQKSIQEPCMKMSSEVGKALKELALSMKRMVYPSNSAIHIENCKNAIEEFIQRGTLPLSKLEELSNQACFKKTKDITSDKKEKRPFLSGGAINPVNEGQNDQAESITVVTILSE
ncbi:aluminum-activated malate transporter 8-like protein [Tanacetum coccineum]